MNLRHLGAYLRERFPPVNMGLFAILFLTVFAVAHFAHGEARPLARLGWREALGTVAAISFFFRLRVFDELKDFAIDSQFHPHRVLQSGRVTLGQLQVLAGAGALVELGWSMLMGWPAVAGWAGALLYSWLMRHEFYVPAFLTPRLVLYAVSHLLIMPLIILWIWLAYQPLGSPLLLLLMLLSLLGGFAFELARKIHVPEAERAGWPSYSSVMGFRRAILVILLVLLTGCLVQGWLLTRVQAGAWAFGVLTALYLATVAVYGLGLSKPREATLRRAELLVSLFILSSYLFLLVEIQLTSGR
ncbi:UbiA family prenyltransferase [Hymenobacter sp. BT175]|uniref:UbiA family prenyltransferase n=1 Tax=Hymenobacter translucens TaxID=2886507 RepID=UPI001D0E4B6B|nr:UbiA family prenyltransferase [Hymenobacter translucens]MCC2548862.1 UbiA family prenyltransferase [Hymenobacter translucens]